MNHMVMYCHKFSIFDPEWLKFLKLKSNDITIGIIACILSTTANFFLGHNAGNHAATLLRPKMVQNFSVNQIIEKLHFF